MVRKVDTNIPPTTAVPMAIRWLAPSPVPLAIAGALIFMYTGGITMNIFSQIGIIMLIGLVAKNGILIVEFANQKQESGENKMQYRYIKL